MSAARKAKLQYTAALVRCPYCDQIHDVQWNATDGFWFINPAGEKVVTADALVLCENPKCRRYIRIQEAA